MQVFFVAVQQKKSHFFRKDVLQGGAAEWASFFATCVPVCAVYYSWFDTAVNAYLIEQGALDVVNGATIGLVVETHCNYFAPLSFPQTVDVGLRVAHRGTSSVRYELGIFGSGDTAAAQGHFVHVYVDALTRKPAPLSPTLVSVLDALL